MVQFTSVYLLLYVYLYPASLGVSESVLDEHYLSNNIIVIDIDCISVCVVCYKRFRTSIILFGVDRALSILMQEISNEI